jgi:hypothetical protein
LFEAYFGKKKEPPADEPAPTRRALPSPFASPFPQSDFPGPTIGVPNDIDYPVMNALYAGPQGDFFKENRIRIYGWVDFSENASTSRRSNVPLSYNIVPNQLELDQLVITLERALDTVQTDSIDWGFNWTSLYGIDYRYTTAKGWFSDQLLKHNNLYGYDPLVFYGEIYFPRIAQGMTVRVGRYISPPDIEAQLAAQNYVFTRSLMFTYDPFTFTGVLASTKIDDHWTVLTGIHAGNDMAPWTTSASPNGQALVRWISRDNTDCVLAGVNSIGDGKYRNQHDDLQMIVATWYHKFNDRFLSATEGYYIWQHDALKGGTVINGPPRPFFEAVGPGPPIPGISSSMGVVNFLAYQLSKKSFIALRSDFFDDFQGERTGFATPYTSHTVALTQNFTDWLTVRPEIRFEYAWDAKPYDNGTRRDQFIFSVQTICKF